MASGAISEFAYDRRLFGFMWRFDSDLFSFGIRWLFPFVLIWKFSSLAVTLNETCLLNMAIRARPKLWNIRQKEKKIIDTNLPRSDASVTFFCQDTACNYRVMVITRGVWYSFESSFYCSFSFTSVFGVVPGWLRNVLIPVWTPT